MTLFFGGVFGHNIGGVTSYANAGAQYVDDTYSTGTNATKSGSFAHTKAHYNAYPLDGVSEHLYISQGGLVSSNTFRQYEDWVRQAYTKYEGTSTPKQTIITEFAWETTNSANASGVSQAVQDTNLVTSFGAIKATPYVQMAIWFSLQDSTASGQYFGVLDTAGSPKQSYPDFQRAEQFEGIYANGTTNFGIFNYFNGLGQAVLGDPYDNGQGAWVYAFLNGYAQDCSGGSHLQLTLMSSTNGTFELNNLHGFWSFYNTNNGGAAYGYATTNAYAFGSGTRQDFSLGYLTWDAVNQVVWHSGAVVPPPPVIASQPASVAAVPGGSATFSVSAQGVPPFGYQWRTNGMALAGATNATLSIAHVQAEDFAPYTVLVSNAGGSVLSQVANLTLAVSPAISSPALPRGYLPSASQRN